MTDRRRRQRATDRFGGPFARAVLVVMILGALGFSAISYRTDWVRTSRAYVDDVVAPIQGVVAIPFAALRSGARGLSDHFDVHSENQRLKEENARLRAWYELSSAMRSKMERYEKLLALNPDPAAQVVTARVIGETSGPFVKTRLVNAGSTDGVEPGQAVLTETWLIGRIVTAGRSSSRVLLLKDLNSRVPVMAERNGARAILAGDNSDRPKIEFLRTGHGLVNGDRIVTSGDAGQLPRGLVIGEAVVDRGGAWRVRLYGDDAPVDYVRVVRFTFPSPPEDEIAVPEIGAAGGGESDAAGRTANAGGAG